MFAIFNTLSPLHPFLQANMTLTYLDLARNVLGGTALTALARSVSRHAVLDTLDLRGNVFGLDSTLAFRRQLSNLGSQLCALFDAPSEAINVATPDTTEVFSHSRQVCMCCYYDERTSGRWSNCSLITHRLKQLGR